MNEFNVNNLFSTSHRVELDYDDLDMYDNTCNFCVPSLNNDCASAQYSDMDWLICTKL